MAGGGAGMLAVALSLGCKHVGGGRRERKREREEQRDGTKTLSTMRKRKDTPRTTEEGMMRPGKGETIERQWSQREKDGQRERISREEQ